MSRYVESKIDRNQMEKQIKENGEISITDPDARHMSVSNNGTDISYNMQTVVDAKHHLIAELEVTNSPADQGQLFSMAIKAKETLGVETIVVVADKGYYKGECLEKCEKENIVTIVSKPKAPSTTGNAAYTLDKFKYRKEDDSYVCPTGMYLKCISDITAKEKVYKTKECKDCLHKDKCTKNKRGRMIIQGDYHDVMERADERFTNNLKLYKKRQMLVEHPFGTIKRTLGYTYFLLRGKEKVTG